MKKSIQKSDSKAQTLIPKVLKRLTKVIWEADKNEGDPPEGPTLNDIQNFTQDVAEKDFIQVVVFADHFWVTLSEESWNASDPPAQVSNLQERLFDVFSYDYARDTRNLYNYLSDRTLSEQNQQRRDAWRALTQKLKQEIRHMEEEESQESYSATIFTLSQTREENENRAWWVEATANEAQAISNFILQTEGEPTLERAITLHKQWKQWKESEENLQHPLAPIVRAWIQEKTAKHITKEYDERHPAAIIKHPFGCVREIAFSTEGIGTIREFATPESVNQLSLPLIEPASIIPDVVPITFIDINGKPMDVLQRTKSGAVAHSIRILFEVIMALRTGDKAPIISMPLGDIIHYLNPDGKFHRKNQLKYIIDGINLLDRAAVPWYDAELKKERLWKFLSVTTPIKYEDSNDTRVFFGVSIPPDTHQGYMIQKETHRRLGKESAARFHAYHTVCYLWDKYGTHRGKLIAPTKPIEARNERGELIHPVTKDLLLTKRGKPMKNLYDTQAVKQLPRTDSPEGINRYPSLSNEDLIKACYPNGYTQTSRRVILKRSKAHWETLEKDGYIVIHREQNRWRILPPDNHLSTHRAVVETQKRTV